MAKQIAYLVEPVYVSTTGKVTGKTIRTYEVEISEKPSGYGPKETTITPTGKAYTLQDGIVTSYDTKASLKSKYVSSWNGSNKIKHSLKSLKSISSWSSSLYATPELAIAAKVSELSKQIANRHEEFTKIIEQLIAEQEKVPSIQSIIDTYPELFI